MHKNGYGQYDKKCEEVSVYDFAMTRMMMQHIADALPSDIHIINKAKRGPGSQKSKNYQHTAHFK